MNSNMRKHEKKLEDLDQQVALKEHEMHLVKVQARGW